MDDDMVRETRPEPLDPSPELGVFSRFSQAVATLAGHPTTFVIALASVVVWAACGPLFGFSDTWQLVIATASSVIAFLMVFVIQHTQNRETRGIQVKLAELIFAMRGAESTLAHVEDLSEEELIALQAEVRHRAAPLREGVSRSSAPIRRRGRERLERSRERSR